MSKVLSQLLHAEEPAFSMALTQLERTSGHHSVDVRLIADITTRIRQKIRECGLDPNDTTDKELYHALQGIVKLHDQYLAKAIGTESTATLDTQLSAIARALKKLPIPKSCWVIKHSAAKKLLKALPPKKIMEVLHYQSVDSMLKRENIAEIFTAVRFMETDAWQRRLVKSYKKLRPSDFEIRDIEIIFLDRGKWGSAADSFCRIQRHNITHLKELGVVMILPLPVDRLRGVVITVMPLAIHYINEIRSYSSFFKLQQVLPTFSEVIIRTILDDPKSSVNVSGQDLHWRILQRHFADKKAGDHPELFEPHVQLEDLSWRKAEDILYTFEPALKFWEDLDYVATTSDTPVSLSLMDNAVSYCNGLEYGEHSIGHFRESLWNEIYMRYLGQESIESLVISQLNDQITSVEQGEGIL